MNAIDSVMRCKRRNSNCGEYSLSFLGNKVVKLDSIFGSREIPFCCANQQLHTKRILPAGLLQRFDPLPKRREK